MLFTLYVLIIVGSFIGNVLVITAVIRSPSLRKVRDPKIESKVVKYSIILTFTIIDVNKDLK